MSRAANFLVASALLLAVVVVLGAAGCAARAPLTQPRVAKPPGQSTSRATSSAPDVTAHVDPSDFGLPDTVATATVPTRLTAGQAIAKVVGRTPTVGPRVSVVAAKVRFRVSALSTPVVAWAVAIAPVIVQPHFVPVGAIGSQPRPRFGQAMYVIDANTGRDILASFSSR